MSKRTALRPTPPTPDSGSSSQLPVTYLSAIPAGVLAGARLIGFATGVVVPAGVLSQLGYGAYNFHPGPPAYPGLCPAQLAVYDAATEFGVTAHKMVARVDAGPIVGTILFPVRPGSNVHDVELAAFTRLMQLFWQLAPLLADDPEPLGDLPLAWGTRRSSRRTLRTMCEIPLDIAAYELDRRIGAFGQTPFDIVPTITLHGYRFRLVPEIAERTAEQQPLAATG